MFCERCEQATFKHQVFWLHFIAFRFSSSRLSSKTEREEWNVTWLQWNPNLFKDTWPSWRKIEDAKTNGGKVTKREDEERREGKDILESRSPWTAKWLPKNTNGTEEREGRQRKTDLPDDRVQPGLQGGATSWRGGKRKCMITIAWATPTWWTPTILFVYINPFR